MLIGRYPALLDANVLHPAFVRGALLWFAAEGLFQPCWSADIMREWRKSVQARFVDVTPAWLDGKQAQMTEAFEGAEVSGYEPLIAALNLPDPDDRHVLAAAIAGKCAGIVTANIKHFPAAIVGGYGIEIIHPDDFIVNVIDLDTGRALEACKRHRATLAAPAFDEAQFLERYRATGLIQSHGRLQQHVGLL